MSYVEGRQPVLELLRSKQPVERVMIAKGESRGPLREIAQLAAKRKIPVTQVERSELNRISSTQRHQGVIAEGAAVRYMELPQLLQHRDIAQQPIVLALDEIQDPHNLGALLRNADAFGVQGVLIPKRRSASLNASAIKSSAGAAAYVPVCYVTNLVRALEQCKEAGFWVLGADMQGEACCSAALLGPLVLVIGSEGRGLRRLVKEQCDRLIAIPLVGNVRSLNASAAAAVLLYEMLRQKTSMRN